VTQLRVGVEETTDAAVTEGQKNVQEAARAGAGYIEGARNLTSSVFSTAAVCLELLSPPRGSDMLLILVI
jgi:hypothetical protein